MFTYHICKASPITQNKPIEDITIEISDELPDLEFTKDMERLYKNEAIDLFSALKKSLPQGTLHQLIILMLENHLNLYKGI
jgi:hypothetical protein